MMSKAMRGVLAVAACLACVTAGFAGEPATSVRCKIYVLRLSDECTEKLAETKADDRPCCSACPTAPRPTSCCGHDAAKNCCRQDSCGSTGCCQSAGASSKCCETPVVLKPETVNWWLERVRGCKGCEVVCCPDVTVVSGQTARLQMCSPTKVVTGSCRTQAHGEESECPVQEIVMTGCCVTVRAMANLDNRSVTVSMTCQQGECRPDSAACCDGRCSKGTDCCQAGCSQKPRSNCSTRTLSRTFVCPAGCTAVLDGGRSGENPSSDSDVPFLSELPVIGELFRCRPCGNKPARLVVLVTPTVCGETEGEESTPDAAVKPTDDVPLFAMPVMCGDWQRVMPPPPVAVMQWMAAPPVAVARCLPPAPPMPPIAMEYLPVMPRVVAGQPLSPASAAMVRPAACPALPAPPSPDAELVSLMIEYYEACAAGENIKARNLAARCIALDPTCFAR